MMENLSGAQRAVHPEGHAKAGTYCTNSGTGILVCCYIDALGKVLTKGKKGNRKRFDAFVHSCMQEFLGAGSTKELPPTPSGKPGGDAWLYEVYRCGFIHGFYPGGTARWRRSESARYWTHRGGVTLNIDALVKGFEKGIAVFREKAKADPDLREHFGKYITALD
jgi:hypothetical protein